MVTQKNQTGHFILRSPLILTPSPPPYKFNRRRHPLIPRLHFRGCKPSHTKIIPEPRKSYRSLVVPQLKDAFEARRKALNIFRRTHNQDDLIEFKKLRPKGQSQMSASFRQETELEQLCSQHKSPCFQLYDVEPNTEYNTLHTQLLISTTYT